MTYDILIVLAYVLGLIVLGGIVMVFNNRKMKRLMLQRAQRLWGQMPEDEYTADQMYRISKFAWYKQEQEPFFLDDITWNDLNMNMVFQIMNNTVSAPGEEYLYYLLRTPCLNKEELRKRDELMEFLAEHEEKRVQIQSRLAEVGKMARTSVAEALESLKDAPRLNLSSHIVALVVFFCGFLLIFYDILAAFGVLILVAVINSMTYYMGEDRKTTEIYLGCFQCILRMVDVSKKIRQIDCREIQEQRDKLNKAAGRMKRFRRGSFLLSGKSGVADGPGALVLDLLRTVAHVDLLMYNRMLKEAQLHEADIAALLEGVGELDAMIAAASFRQMLGNYCKPVFTKEKNSLQVNNLYHPLIPDPVANSINVQGGVLVTGSNASGKSTFLKNVALNSILAQTLYTCTAEYYRAPLFRIMTSMTLADNLAGGESYFIVELKALRRIMQEAKSEEPLLCIIDEVLRGTNTIERIAASSRILNNLSREWVICFAATHDIELSYILENKYENYHFEEEITEDDVRFNYLLLPGRTNTRNAIRLLEIMGYDDKIVTDARDCAREFEETGIWKKIDGGAVQ